MRDYAIMREPGPAAKRSHAATRARPRRVAIFAATSQVEALRKFIHDRYLADLHRQYAGHWLEWRSSRSLRFMEWRPDDGADPGTRGREWRAVVALRNGSSEHHVRFEAWSMT